MPKSIHLSIWLLLSCLVLPACSSSLQTMNAASPHCGTDRYAARKAAARTTRPPPIRLPTSTTVGRDGILTLDQPLGEPPEIARVRRGMTFHFAGGFINDGLESWKAVDLDAKIVVLVARRTFSKRAQATRPFDDPVLPAWAIQNTPPSLYARKWSGDGSISEEVVSTVSLTADAEEAFVCAANPAWSAQPQARSFSLPTDTLVSETTLLDYDALNAKQYMKDVPSSGALGWFSSHLPETLKYEWPLALHP